LTTILGEFTFPVDPSSIRNQEARDLKAVKVKVRTPLILPMGPETPIIKLKGMLAETGKDAAYAYTNWILPLRTMYRRPMSIPSLLGDDDMIAGDWAGIGWGSGSLLAASVSDSTIQFIKGVNSVRAIVGSGAIKYSGMQRSFSTARDWSKKEFITTWAYMASAGKVAVELYDNSTAQTIEASVGATAWERELFLLSGFTTIDLSNITRIRVGFDTAGTHYIDRTVAGVGYYLNAVGIRYDGIYNMRKMIIDESYKAIAAFPYEIELWWADEYY